MFQPSLTEYDSSLTRKHNLRNFASLSTTRMNPRQGSTIQKRSCFKWSLETTSTTCRTDTETIAIQTEQSFSTFILIAIF